MYCISSTVYLLFSTAVFLPFPSRLIVAYPQYHSQFCLLYTTSYLRFVSCFHFVYAVDQHLPSHTYVSVCKTTPDKTHNFQWHMFQIHAAPQIVGTVHYLRLFFVTSFLRNYYGGRGRRCGPARSLYKIYMLCLFPVPSFFVFVLCAVIFADTNDREHSALLDDPLVVNSTCWAVTHSTPCCTRF